MVERAYVNPDMMKWAREYAGFTGGYEEELPKRIRNKYELWESGEKVPTWNQLNEVSKKFNVPTAYFFMKSPPDVEFLPNLINYRSLDASNNYKISSPNLISNIRRSQNRREIYMELSNDLNEDIIPFEVPDLKNNKKSFSKYIRKTLNVSLDVQKLWHSSSDVKHYSFLNQWKEALNEKFGLLVFETENVNILEMRGLCIMQDAVPIILLNGKDAVNARIFTLFHELTHLLLGQSAICGDDIDRSEEIFCNSVAGEFLVPSDDLSENFDSLSQKSLTDLSNMYGVSKEVILRRLLDAGYIGQSDYGDYILQLNHVALKSKANSGNYLNNQIKYNGRPYYSILVEAYDSGIISSLEFSRYAGLSRKHIPLLCERLFGVRQ